MKRGWIWLIVILVLLLAAAAVGIFGAWLPYRDAESAMSDGMLEVQQQEDGTLRLTWPQAQKKDHYLIRIFEKTGETASTVYMEEYLEENSCVLPQLPDDRELTVSICTVVDYKLLWREEQRLSENVLTVTTKFHVPKVEELLWLADPDEKTVTVSYTMGQGENCQMYVQHPDTSWEEFLDTQEQETLLRFGKNGTFPMPSYGGSTRFQVSAYRKETDIVFYGLVCDEFSVAREDLLGRNLNPVFKDEGNNVCSFTWDETKGEGYQVQRWDPSVEDWEILAEIPGDGERTYTTLHMPAHQTFTYRIVAVGGQLMEDSDFAAVSEEMEQVTQESPVFCTIWPTKDLEVYNNPQKDAEIGTVKAGKALCVIDATEGMFAVQVEGNTGYIDSNFCLINLPEYLIDLCEYDITNSYSSLYMVHEFAIPEVTDVITGGYEKVKLDSGEFLVPLLYPTAQRLAVAARTAIEQGYILRIYDAFRPQKATREIYDLTEKILKDPLPEEPFTDKKTIEELELPEKKKEVDPETGEEVEIPLTYEDVMISEEFGLSNFLAKGGSYHNYGLALDLTIVDLYTGKELEMQTSMHDLSHYSVLKNNKKEAKKLASIMTSAGFGGLMSEWWHFQDNVARDELDIHALWYGVSASCWMADDHGWRYRKSSGYYYKDCEVTIDDTGYVFDEQGYVIAQW